VEDAQARRLSEKRSAVVEGYEYQRGQFVTFTAEELKALDVESSKVIDLEKFVPRGDIDPVYFDSPYYLYPDGPIAVETLRVIGAAMAEAGVVGLGRLTLRRRERMVMVEPRGTGMPLITLRAADEVRAPQFSSVEGDLDAEMVAIARAIIEQRTGTFDPKTYKDRYQEALRELIEAQDQGAPHQAAARRRRRRSRSRRSFIDASRHCSYRYPVAERGRRGLLSGQPRSLRGGARRHERCNTRNPLLLRDGPARSRQSSHIQYSYLIAIRLTPNIGHLTINFIAHSTSTV
jgi:Ku protein